MQAAQGSIAKFQNEPNPGNGHFTGPDCTARSAQIQLHRFVPGNAWTVVFFKNALSVNSVRCPAFLPGAGSSRAASGLFHLYARDAMSPRMRAICSSLT